MKKIILSLLFTSSMVYAQTLGVSKKDYDNNDCNKFIQKEIINKIKDYKPTNLLPYSSNGSGWSFMDKKSKKILTEPLMQFPYTFNPYIRFLKKGCEIYIYSDYTTKSIENPIFIDGEDTKENLLAIMDEPGFEVNENGEIIAYSKIYKRDDLDDANNILVPIKHKNDYYAILHKKDRDVVINKKGLELENFSFKKLKTTGFKKKDEELFYYKDFSDKQGLITLAGEKILEGEILKSPDSSLGYSVQYDEKDDCNFNFDAITISGVLDLSTQKWIIEPQKKYKIYSMVFTSSKIIDSNSIEDRKKANIYFVASQGKEHFAIDLKGKAIKPILKKTRKNDE